jgi:hypothetical protein
MNPFEQLIESLSRSLGLSLQTEKGTICKLLIQGSLQIQLEYEPSAQRILIASFLCELPPGKFREDTLKEALQANNSLDRLGIFGYSEKNNSLAFFLYVSEKTDHNVFSELLLRFIEVAQNWKAAVESGQLHLVSQETRSPFPPPFSLP